MGGIGSIRKLRRASQLPKNPRTFVRAEPVPIIRDRRPRTIEINKEPLEERAIPKGRIAGATLPERIVYKKLEQILPGGEDDFIFQRGFQGGRLYLGGYVLDFMVINPMPPVVIEVLGDFWHQAVDEFSDNERAFTVMSLGFAYGEIWEHDIYASDELTEEILRGIIDRKGV